MEIIQELKTKCASAGIELVEKGAGHFQLKGQLLVNYYPTSAKQSAYISGTTAAKRRISVDEAIAMTYTVPEQAVFHKTKRKSSYKIPRNSLLKKHPYCRWCGCLLTEETATLDHIIPLHKGGMNNPNNYALACAPCNNKRGSDMPELKAIL